MQKRLSGNTGVVGKDAPRLSPYCDEHAVVRWHNTNEQFTAAEFVRANCEYPGEWQVEVTRVEQAGAAVIAAARVWGEGISFHVVSFLRSKTKKSNGSTNTGATTARRPPGGKRNKSESRYAESLPAYVPYQLSASPAGRL